MRRAAGRLGRHRALVAALAVHAALLAAVCTGLLDGATNDSSERRRGRGVDFFSVYQAGVSARESCNMYAETGCPLGVPYAYPYRYLPFVGGALAQAATAVEPETAYWAWVGVLEAVLLLGGLFVLGRAPPRLRAPLAWVAALFTPFYLEVFLAQFSFLMGALVAVTAYALDRVGADRAAAGRATAAWTAALLVKTNAFLLAMLVAAQARLRMLLLAGGTVVVLNVPYFLIEPGSWPEAQENLGKITDPALTDAGALGLQSLVSLLAEPDAWVHYPESWRLGVSLALMTLIGLPVLVAVWRRPDPIVGALALMSLHFVIYPDVWEHHYSLLLPLLALAIVLRAQLARGLLVCAAALALPTPYALLEWVSRDDPAYDPIAFDAQPPWPDAAVVGYHAWKVVPVLAILALSVRWLWSAPAPAPLADERRSTRRPRGGGRARSSSG